MNQNENHPAALQFPSKVEAANKRIM